MAQTFIHTGTHTSIPDSASPGLLFVRYLLPILDSLDPESVAAELDNALTPDSTFTINGGQALTAEKVRPMQLMRSKKVSSFGHEVKAAWDIDLGGGARTVMYESISTTVMKQDPQALELPVPEITIIELVATPGAGVGGYRAKSMRTYMHPASINQRTAALFGAANQ